MRITWIELRKWRQYGFHYTPKQSKNVDRYVWRICRRNKLGLSLYLMLAVPNF